MHATVTPSIEVTTDGVGDSGGSSSAGPIAAGVSVAVVAIIAIISKWLLYHIYLVEYHGYTIVLIIYVKSPGPLFKGG